MDLSGGHTFPEITKNALNKIIITAFGQTLLKAVFQNVYFAEGKNKQRRHHQKTYNTD